MTDRDRGIGGDALVKARLWRGSNQADSQSESKDEQGQKFRDRHIGYDKTFQRKSHWRIAMPRLLRLVGLGLLFASLLWIHSIVAQQGTKGGEWRVYGGENGSTHYSPLDQI